jgi:hypothetical protein
MSTLSIHPVEYLRLHVHYEELRTRLLRSLGVFLGEVVPLVAVLLAAGVVVFAFMQLGASVSLTASYDSAITEMVVPPLQEIPSGI